MCVCWSKGGCRSFDANIIFYNSSIKGLNNSNLTNKYIKTYFTVQFIFKITASDSKRNEKVFFFCHIKCLGLNLAHNQRNLKYQTHIYTKDFGSINVAAENHFVPKVIIHSTNKYNIIRRRLASFAF